MQADSSRQSVVRRPIQRPPLVTIESPGKVPFKMSPAFCTVENLMRLCGLERPTAASTDLDTSESFGGDASALLVMDAETEELDELEPDDNGRYPVRAGGRYSVALESDLESESESEQPESLLIARYNEHVRRQLAIERERASFIRERYKPLYPHLYEPIRSHEDEIFLPAFLDIVRAVKSQNGQTPKEAVISALKDIGLQLEAPTGLWSFDMFLPQWCDQYVNELLHFEETGLPVNAPNSMNHYGVILQELGWTPWLDELRSNYLQPLSNLLFGKIAETLDSQHTFIVEYRLDEDTKLDFHVDDAEVTLNACLGREFEGGELYFRGLYDIPQTHNEHVVITHRIGRALLHLGSHRHGATSITQGERFNLIVWMRNSEWRQAIQNTCDHNHEPGCCNCRSEDVVGDEGAEQV